VRSRNARSRGRVEADKIRIVEAARLEKDISQSALARAVGLHDMTVMRVANGERTLDALEFIVICRELERLVRGVTDRFRIRLGSAGPSLIGSAISDSAFARRETEDRLKTLSRFPGASMDQVRSEQSVASSPLGKAGLMARWYLLRILAKADT